MLTAEAVMEPCGTRDTSAFPKVESGVPVNELYEPVLNSKAPLLVVDDNADPLGVVTPRSIIKSLAPDPESAGRTEQEAQPA
nr:hypothetical protein GCM10025732_53250 [Glycomyces mayteni]